VTDGQTDILPRHSLRYAYASRGKNWRILSTNVNSIAGKPAEYANIVEYSKPDVIPMQETKLGQGTHLNAEFMPSGFGLPKRRDRKVGGGGVLVAVRDCYPAVEVDIPECSAEVIWVEVSLRNQHKLYQGSYYRPPGPSGGNTAFQIDELEKSLSVIHQKTRNNPNYAIFLGGDFNMGDIDWEHETVIADSREKLGSEKLIQSLGDYHLSQVQREPTREHRILDLLCTNKPPMVKSTYVILGLSDRAAVVADCDVKPMYHKQKQRFIHIFSRVNWSKMKEDTIEFASTFLPSIMKSAEQNWNFFKTHIIKIMDSHVPTKTTSSRYSPG